MEACSWRRVPGSEEPQFAVGFGWIRCPTPGDGLHYTKYASALHAHRSLADGRRSLTELFPSQVSRYSAFCLLQIVAG
jgi:hypothetical protein|eukprot:COSAG06_NODE_1140_length_10558_cov_34.662492_11_plen_78_part_00